MANYTFTKNKTVGTKGGVIELAKATQKQLKELFDLGHPYVQKTDKKAKDDDTEKTIQPPTGLE